MLNEVDFELVITTAKEVTALIAPLAQPEQQAVLELAETLRGYRQVKIALANPGSDLTQVSESLLEVHQVRP